MYFFRRSALLLALLLPAPFAVLAQSSGSSSSQAPATPDQQQPQAQAPSSQQGQVSVQARIKQRREQRRAQAIHDTYSHTWEAFVGGGYQWFKPGPNLQRNTMYAWDVALTRYWSERLGVTIDGRGYYGTTYVGLNPSNITKPAISHYDALLGPTYRFYLRPRYSVAGRVMGGIANGNFSGDTNGFGSICFAPQGCLLYSDSTTYAFSVSALGEWNLTPNLSLRLAPEYFATGFGSSYQTNLGFTYGAVYRFGKQ